MTGAANCDSYGFSERTETRLRQIERRCYSDHLDGSQFLVWSIGCRDWRCAVPYRAGAG